MNYKSKDFEKDYLKSKDILFGNVNKSKDTDYKDIDHKQYGSVNAVVVDEILENIRELNGE